MRSLSQKSIGAHASASTSRGGANSRQPSPKRRNASRRASASSGQDTPASGAPDILESLPGGVIALDAEERITYVNRAVERMLGSARAELTSRNVREAYPLAFGAPLFEMCQRARREHASLAGALFFQPRALWVEALASPLGDTGVVVALNDITERKRLEEEREQALSRERALRRQMETAHAHALRNDARLRRLMDSQLIGVIISASGRIIEANDVFLKLLGYAREDFPPEGIPWVSLVPEDIAGRNLAAHNQLIATGECAPYETDLYRKDGSRVPALIGAVRQRPGEPETVGVVVDLSAYKQLERALAERASELDVTIEGIADGVMLYDARGTLTRLNHAARAMFGISNVEDYTRLPLSRRIRLLNIRRADGEPIIPRRATIGRMLRVAARAGGTPLDLRLRTLDGREIVISVTAARIHDAQGAPIGAVVVAHDTTARMSLEQSLMEVNERLIETSNEAERRARQWYTIIETIADGVVILDREGRITQVNKTMRLMLGIGDQPVEAFANRPFEEWRERYNMRDSSGEPFPAETWPIGRVLAGERLVANAAIDMLVRAPDGQEVTISVSGAPIRDEKGEISGAVFVIRDITERKAHESEMVETLDNVAHELNSPLAALDMLAQILTREARLPSSQIAILNEKLKQLSQISGDLRTALTLESASFPLNREKTDLSALCARIATDQRAQTGREVMALLPDHPVYANVDPVRIGQTLTNLISNAIKYGPKEQPVTMRLLEIDDAVRVETHDEGPGIPPEVQQRLFERFYRAPSVKHRQSGIGLGLYISRRLVELHGGHIHVESEPGHGTTFWFTLPLQTDRIASA